MIARRTLSTYFAGRFLAATLIVFGGLFLLVLVVDYLELMRRAAANADASSLFAAQTALYRVPAIVEQLMPFCVLIGAMSCYLALSRSMELVVARAAGISAWQFVLPAALTALLLGVLATAAYNPVSSSLQEQAVDMETQLIAGRGTAADADGFWFSQTTDEGTSMIHAVASQGEGRRLSDVVAIRLSPEGQFQERIEAQQAELQSGFWNLKNARIFRFDAPPKSENLLKLKTNLTATQVRESVSKPDTVSFWRLPEYIATTEYAGLATAGYRFQYQKLIARPFMLLSMVLLAAAVSLRFFRFGGVQKMVLSGVGAGFLLYVLSKITEDLSAAELMHPIAAAWLPVCIGGLTGFLALLYQEDG